MNNRKAKGIAIEKILESTQKPWFMLNGLEYNRPSPFTAAQSKSKNTPADKNYSSHELGKKGNAAHSGELLCLAD